MNTPEIIIKSKGILSEAQSALDAYQITVAEQRLRQLSQYLNDTLSAGDKKPEQQKPDTEEKNAMDQYQDS